MPHLGPSRLPYFMPMRYTHEGGGGGSLYPTADAAHHEIDLLVNSVI